MTNLNRDLKRCVVVHCTAVIGQNSQWVYDRYTTNTETIHHAVFLHVSSIYHNSSIDRADQDIYTISLEQYVQTLIDISFSMSTLNPGSVFQILCSRAAVSHMPKTV